MISIYYSLALALMAAALVGLLSGTLGCFAVLRRQSLLGDAVAHAALPGICLAFWMTHSKESWVLLLGAIVAGWAGTLLVGAISRHSIIKEDAALGLILSVFFGIGLVILTALQSTNQTGQAGLMTWLFGSMAGVSIQEIMIMAIVTSMALCGVMIGWHPLVVCTFDRFYAHTLGINTRRMEWMITFLLVVAIAIGLQLVGVVLMSSLMIAPAVSARQWVNRLGPMVMIAGAIGMMATMMGVMISSLMRIPTGPTIVLCVSVFVMVSILVAPHRGIVWRLGRRRVVLSEP